MSESKVFFISKIVMRQGQMIMTKSLLSCLAPILFVLEVALLDIFPTLFPGTAGFGFLAISFFLICVLMLVTFLKVLAVAVISPPVLARYLYFYRWNQHFNWCNFILGANIN